jgi:death on curing protein
LSISLVEPEWLTLDDVLAIHEDQIGRYGGPEGIRDQGLVASAVHRPQQLYHYDGERDILTLAVRLGIGIAQNHGFVDGNKRAGAFSMIEFLALNGAWLEMPNDTRLARLFLLTLGERMTEAELGDVLYGYLIAANS